MRKLIALLLLVFAAPAFSYSVSGGRIYDDTGKEIQLKGVNWFGAENESHVVNGLWARGYKDMIQQMKSLGFNAVRLPFCPITLDNVTLTEGIVYGYNPDLEGLKSLEVYDKIVQELDAQGFYILLDHHRPDCMEISELWYTSSYSEQAWIDDLKFVASRYKNVKGVIGLDLKNEPHGKATWGTGNTSTDWNTASEKAASAVLGIAPNWLMFVEGIQENMPNGSSVCSSAWGHFYGENLEPVNCTASKIKSDRLVYSPHTYGPDVYNMDYFSASNFPANMPAIWEKYFGFLSTKQPVVLGEFGGKYGWGDPRDVTWQNALVDWLISKQMTSSFYWSWNPNSVDTGGILMDDWYTVRTDKMDLLKRLWAGWVPVTSTPPTTTPPTTTPPTSTGPISNITTSNTNLTATLAMKSDDGTAWCGNITVANKGNSTLTWSVGFDLVGTLTSSYNAVFSYSGSHVTASGEWWSTKLMGGQSTTFEMCGNRGSSSGGGDTGGGSSGGGSSGGSASAPYTTPVPTSSSMSAVSKITSDDGQKWCGSVTVTNNGGNTASWGVTFDLTGTLTSSYNASFAYSGTKVTATGASWNKQLMSGQSTTFEMCGDRGTSSGGGGSTGGGSTTPSAPYTTPVPTNSALTAVSTITSDNGSSWCGNVAVTNTGKSTVSWGVTFDLTGKITSSYNASFAYSGVHVTATGASWNKQLMSGQSTTFEMCGTR